MASKTRHLWKDEAEGFLAASEEWLSYSCLWNPPWKQEGSRINLVFVQRIILLLCFSSLLFSLWASQLFQLLNQLQPQLILWKLQDKTIHGMLHTLISPSIWGWYTRKYDFHTLICYFPPGLFGFPLTPRNKLLPPFRRKHKSCCHYNDAKSYKFLYCDEVSRHLVKALGIENQELKVISLVWIFNKDFLLTLTSLHGIYLGSNWRNSLPKKSHCRMVLRRQNSPRFFFSSSKFIQVDAQIKEMPSPQHRITESFRMEKIRVQPALPRPPLVHVPKCHIPHGFWTIPGMGNSITSTGSPFQSLIMFSTKKYFLISDLTPHNPLWKSQHPLKIPVGWCQRSQAWVKARSCVPCALSLGMGISRGGIKRAWGGQRSSCGAGWSCLGAEQQN